MPKVYDGYRLIDGSYYKISDRSGPYSINSAGVASLISGTTGGGGSTPSVDRELATVTYLVKTAFTGASVGDTVTLTQVLDLSGAQPTTVATLWRNQSTATDLAGAPSAANLTIAGAGGLASTQLPGTLGSKASSGSVSVAPATDALFPTNNLAAVGAARQLPAAVSSGVSANTALTTTTRRISMVARLSDIRFAIGSAAQTASSTTHFIAMGERLDLAVPATPNIAVLSATATPGVLEVSELT